MARNKKAQRTRSTTPNLITRWGEKIGWGRRVKAVCKPCWEIKYCPYGPLIEEFPLHSERDERSCRIFGHDCPVFYVAEPFTETKELRNISRTIPRVTQFRVLKRENQICCVCKSAVSDPDVEFDHVIPWSKGGPSDEWNIRLLCRKCNRRKRANFEDEFLISNLGDHLAEPMGVELIRWLLMVVAGGREIEAREGRPPTAEDYGRAYNRGRTGGPEEMAAYQYVTIREFFQNARPTDLPSSVFKALALRWGAVDGNLYTLKWVSKKTSIDLPALIDAERDLVRRVGYVVKSNSGTMKQWTRA